MLQVIEAARHLGSRTLEDGTELIGHVPHVAPEAWLHIIYAPLSQARVEDVSIQIGRPVAKEYQSFLQRMNGLSLFSGELSLFGLRSDFRRTGDAVRQPFSIRTPNTVERPRDADEALVFIGSYFDDGSMLYIDPHTSEVHRCSRTSVESLNRWKSFFVFLDSEAERLATLFDVEGRMIDPSVSTAPSPALPV